MGRADRPFIIPISLKSVNIYFALHKTYVAFY